MTKDDTSRVTDRKRLMTAEPFQLFIRNKDMQSHVRCSALIKYEDVEDARTLWRLWTHRTLNKVIP